MTSTLDMATTTGSRQASLLGIPRELRLQIYDYLFAVDLNHIMFYECRREYTKEGSRTVVKSDKDQALIIPWVNLMLTCKTTAVELRSVMRETSFLTNKSYCTYFLDLEATHLGTSLGRTVWRHIPCDPNQAEFLEVSYNASRGFQAWGDGGPHTIMSSLYQTLNHLIHRGPRMFDSKTSLPQPMHLKELRIIIESREDEQIEREDLSDRDKDPETTALSLGSYIGQVNNTGVLRGFVDSIRLHSSEHALHWAVDEVDGSGIPDLWSGYGFEWGV